MCREGYVCGEPTSISELGSPGLDQSSLENAPAQKSAVGLDNVALIHAIPGLMSESSQWSEH